VLCVVFVETTGPEVVTSVATFTNNLIMFFLASVASGPQKRMFDNWSHFLIPDARSNKGT